MLILFPYVSLYSHSQQSLKRQQGGESICSVSSAYCKAGEVQKAQAAAYKLHGPGPKRLIATLLVVDSLQHLLLLSPSSCFSELMVLSGYPGG